MMSLTPSGMIVGLITQVETLMGGMACNGYTALMEALKAPLAAFATLFIVLMGYGITHGFIQAPLKELYKIIFRLGFIFFFAMNWGNFSFYIVDFFDKGMGTLATVMMKASHTPMGGSSIGAGLQSVLNEVFEAGWKTLKLMSIKNWWPYYTALFIWGIGLAIVAVALLEIIVAKVMLAVCMAVAPLFLILTLFDKTRSFFDRWLGAIVGFSLLFLFASTLVGLCMAMVHAAVASIVAGTTPVNQLSFAPILLVACIAIPCLIAAASLAKNIGGACHTAGGSAVVGGLIGSSMGAFINLNQMNNAWQSLRGKKRQPSLNSPASTSSTISQPQSNLTTRGEI